MVNGKRILFTGGGTAGHVTVNLALIPYFREQGWTIDYIGSKSGIERKLIENVPGVTYYPIATGKLRRYFSLENMKDPFRVLKGIAEAWQIIRQTKPNIVFSKGGFVSVPVVIAAKLNRVPTILHESDLTPGLANKISTPFAQHIVTTFPETISFLPAKKATYIGAVVREELFTGEREIGWKLTQLTPGKPVILLMGGSIGSQRLNQMLRNNLDVLLAKYQFIHICGPNNVDPTIEREGYVQFAYVQDELKHLFAITDYVISRAGANAIFEFLALQIPMLLIPLPLSASRGDQIDNAKSFQKQGFAHVLMEEDMDDTSFVAAVTRLVEEGAILQDKMKQYQADDARQKVIKLIETMAK